MTAQKGSICKISDGTGTGAVDIVALRTTDLTVNGQAVDVTTRDSAGFRELVAGAGIASLQVKGDGVVTDSTSFGTLADRCTAQSLNAMTVHFGAAGTYTGLFQLTQFDIKGGYNDAQTYGMTFESSGSLTRA